MDNEKASVKNRSLFIIHVTVTDGQTFSFDDFIELATWFHNYPAPGLFLGGYMVKEAKKRMPGRCTV